MKLQTTSSLPQLKPGLPLPSPEQLKYKILVKNKKRKEDMPENQVDQVRHESGLVLRTMGRHFIKCFTVFDLMKMAFYWNDDLTMHAQEDSQAEKEKAEKEKEEGENGLGLGGTGMCLITSSGLCSHLLASSRALIIHNSQI